MSRNKGKVLLFSGLLLIAAACFLIAYNLHEEQRAGETVEQVLQSVPNKIRCTQSPQKKMPVTEKTDRMLPDYMLNPYMDMPIENIGGIAYIGILRIPALELELPVISQWSYANLKSAPCRYKGSAYLDTLILCGHNYRSHFGKLKKLREGDEVSFTDMDGNVFLYEGALVETLMPTAIEEMESGGWALTMFTCTIGGASRVTVRCDRMEEPEGKAK